MADWDYAINKDGLKAIVKNYAESLGKSVRFNNGQRSFKNVKKMQLSMLHFIAVLFQNYTNL
ncbi:hypothetical protein BpHYR1_015462 [Brachionus plicatilis]|uniref:Uncharacterized protein n=1 Tax=Brachionus plicatilis TaxID=10195 RepID=A0A3M7PU07_BRAPC|nr:hypothetical protein BpHYR1_015462 [Brachionus plicatilis]